MMDFNARNPYVTPDVGDQDPTKLSQQQSPGMYPSFNDNAQVQTTGVDPDTKRKLLAALLKGQQGQGQGGETQYVNGWAVPQSPLGQAAGAIGGLVASNAQQSNQNGTPSWMQHLFSSAPQMSNIPQGSGE